MNKTWRDKMAEAKDLELQAEKAKKDAAELRRMEMKAERAAANAKERAEKEALKSRLESEYDLEDHPKRHMLWSKAWDLGHSGGLSDVESYYSDLAELLKP